MGARSMTTAFVNQQKNGATSLREAVRSLLPAVWFSLGVTGSAMAVSVPAVADTQATYEFNLPAQAVSESLRTIGQVTSTNILFDPETVAQRNAPEVKGSLTASGAIEKVIAGTGLQARRSGNAILVTMPGAKTTLSHTQAESIRLAQADSRNSATTTESGAGGSESERSGLEEIVVTAQKRSENLQEVPVPVTVLRADSLVASNQTRIQDYFTRIPGLNVTPSVQGQQNLTIRGITTGFSNPTVGVVIDDVPFGGSGGRPSGLMVPDIDPGDLQRIEVLKGPQGTLYGASSMGGLFKFVTVDPSMDEVSGRVVAGLSSISGGDDLGHIVRGMINLPLGDTFAIRASGVQRCDPGFIDNVQTGQEDVNDADLWGGRVSALWKLTDNLSIKLSAMNQSYEGDAQSEVDFLPGVGELEQSRLIDSGDFERKTQVYSAVVTAQVGGVNITSVTGYNRGDNVDLFDFSRSFGPAAAPLYGVVGTPVVTRADIKRLTQETRVSIPINEHIEWLVGGFYSRESQDFDQEITYVDPATGAFVANRTLIDNKPLEIREIAGFTDVTIYFSERFDLQLGGRFSRIKQWIDAGGTAQRFPPTGTGVLTVAPAVRMEPDEVFTHLITPRYRISDDLMVYARAASGYRIGSGGTSTPNDRCILFNYPCQYGPDKTYNYEIGAKGDLIDGVLSFDASIYYIDWKEIQIQGYSPAANTTFNTNGSRARSEGVELSVTARPTLGLTISAWASYNNAELTEDLPAGPGLPLGRSGDPLPLSVEWSGNLSIDQSFPVSGEITATLGGSVTYIDERPALLVNAGARTIYPSYTKTDLLAKLDYQDWTATLYINNVTNEDARLSGGPGFFPAESAGIVQPRTIGMSLMKTF